MNTRTQTICALLGPIYLVLLTTAFTGAGILPAHSPMDTAAEVAAVFQADPARIRLALVLTMFTTALYIPFCAVIAVRMARIEGPFPVLSSIQLVSGFGTAMGVTVESMIWQTAAFRPDRSPELTLLLDDLANIMLAGMTTPFFLQSIAIAVVGFMDKSGQPLFPRWFCWSNLIVTMLVIPGGFTVLHKTGPFAWNGAYALYTPYITWAGWIFITSYLLIRDIRRQAPAQLVATAA
jgi:hypothetical protein